MMETQIMIENVIEKNSDYESVFPMNVSII